MEWIKKYWWIVIIILVLPIGINYILLRPTPFSIPMVGKDTDWLSFWSGYLGAILSSGVAFIILAIQYKQNNDENKTNRKIQINSIIYQQELSRLDGFITSASKLITATNTLALRTLCRQMQQDNIAKIETQLLNSIDYIHTIQRELFLHLSEEDERQKNLGNSIDDIIDNFIDVQYDIQKLLAIIHLSDTEMTSQELKEVASDNDDMSERLKKAILEYQPSQYEGVKLEWEWEMIALALVDLVQDESDKLYDLIDDFVGAERKRIQNILTEEI